MKREKIILITHSFPFGSSEKTFLSPEVKILEKYFDIVIVSRNIKEIQTTELSEKTKIIRYNSKDNYHILILFFKTFFSKDYWKEIFCLIKNKKNVIICLKQATTVMMRMFHFRKFLYNNIIKIDKQKKFIFYTYWNGYETYACKKIKRDNDILITRTHGGDLYLKVDNCFYQPYKEITNDDIDRIYFISDYGKKYYLETFKILKQNQMAVSKMGTFDPKIKNPFFESETISLVTLSRIFWVKRIDKLITILSEIDDLKIEWTHIGDGELCKEICKFAHDKLDKKNNISYKFLGSLESNKIFEFFKYNKIDFLVNCSFSEGLPVSIMECMSCGIPALAVSVGGIPEIVSNGKNGFLIDPDFNTREFSSILKKYLDMSVLEKINLRNNSFITWKEKYNAKINYENFAQNILNLAKEKYNE